MIGTQEDVERHLADHVEWFQDAFDTVLRHAEPDARSRPCGHCLHLPSSSQQISSSQKSATAPSEGLDLERLIQSMKISIPPGTDAMKDWNQIAGNSKAKLLLYESLVLALELPEVYEMTNVLLFGPAGTGKTMMALCMARFSHWTVFKVTSDVILQTSRGEPDK